MTIIESQFSLLSFAEQYAIIWDHGVFLGAKKDNDSPSFLYQVNNFYTEVIYNSTLSKIEGIRSFTELEELKPYLDKIKLDDIFEVLLPSIKS
jgi:hypothetical protein